MTQGSRAGRSRAGPDGRQRPVDVPAQHRADRRRRRSRGRPASRRCWRSSRPGSPGRRRRRPARTPGRGRRSMLSRRAKIVCSATWSPQNVSGPNATCSMPTRPAQYSKWSITDSMLCRGCAVRQRGVRRGRHPDHPAGRGDRPQHVVGLHPGRVPHRPGARVGDEHRRAALCSQVSSAVRSEEWDRSMARPSWFIRVTRPAAERGQPAVAGLVQPAAERVGVGVGDADLAQAQAVEHVQPVDLVLDRGGRLQPEHQARRARSGAPRRCRPRCGWS